ncbi:fimbrial protein [Vibrio hepatarius]|uniref:fimbrial protein n=1 Tax=Vibrio hepatarius TaxID=171383 RepID=UPI001C0A4722|nr:fimbrial protein [Vibrio hepatarius]MBU2899241.1 type 1 fimbrial protein [Vibrio hepatarius]
MNIISKMIEKNGDFLFFGLSKLSKHGLLGAVASCILLSVNAFAIEDTTTSHVKFSGQFVLPTCDAAVYDANNTIVPSGTVLLPSLDSTEATTIGRSSIGEKIVFKIGPVNPQACIDVPLTQFKVDVSASGYSSGNVLNNVSGSGPSNIGVEVLQEDGSSILNFGDQASQSINPNDVNTTLVPFSAQLYNKTGGAPNANGYILSVATFTTAYY